MGLFQLGSEAVQNFSQKKLAGSAETRFHSATEQLRFLFSLSCNSVLLNYWRMGAFCHFITVHCISYNNSSPFGGGGEESIQMN